MRKCYCLSLFFLNHSPKSRLIQLKKEKLEYSPGEHEYGLFPAPIHVGEYKQYIVRKNGLFLEFGWNVSAFLLLFISIGVKLFLFYFIFLLFNLYLTLKNSANSLLSRSQNYINLTHWSFSKQHYTCSIWFPKYVILKNPIIYQSTFISQKEWDYLWIYNKGNRPHAFLNLYLLEN